MDKEETPVSEPADEPLLEAGEVQETLPEGDVESPPSLVDEQVLATPMRFDAEPATIRSNPDVSPFAQPAQTIQPPAPVFQAPPTDSSSVPPVPADGIGQKKSKKSLFIIGGIIAAALVLGGGGTALAYNLWYQNPNKVLGDALINAASAKSVIFTSTMNINLHTGSAAGMPSKLTLSMDGKGSYEVGGQLDIKLATQYNGKDVSFSGSGIVDKDQNIYIKVNDVRKIINDVADGEQLPSSYDKLISDIDGKWIKISADDTKEYSEEWSKTQTCINGAVKKLQDNKSETKELLDLYKKNPFIIIKDKLGSKDGNLGYDVDVDKDVSKHFSDGLKNTQIYKDLDKCDPSGTGSDDATSGIDSLDSDNTATTENHTELWVSRFGHKITQIKWTTKDSSSTSTISDADFTFEPQFNKAVSIDVPKDFITLKQLQKDIESTFGSAFSEAQTQSSSVSNQNAAATVASAAEEYAANNRGSYPTSASQLKSYINNPSIASALTDSVPSASNPDAIQYRLCGGRQIEVQYFDVSQNKAVALSGYSCKVSTT